MKQAFGFWWPNGGEAYGIRYIKHADDMAVALRHCRKRRTAIQAGGNVGVWPKRLSTLFGDRVTIEPESGNFTAMSRNLAVCPNVRLVNAALGSTRGRAALRFNSKNIGGHRLTDGNDFDVTTIDALGAVDVDFIQLDVEGFEHPAL